MNALTGWLNVVGAVGRIAANTTWCEPFALRPVAGVAPLAAS